MDDDLQKMSWTKTKCRVVFWKEIYQFNEISKLDGNLIRIEALKSDLFACIKVLFENILAGFKGLLGMGIVTVYLVFKMAWMCNYFVRHCYPPSKLQVPLAFIWLSLIVSQILIYLKHSLTSPKIPGDFRTGKKILPKSVAIRLQLFWLSEQWKA